MELERMNMENFNTLKTSQLRSVFSNLSGNFLTSNFPTFKTRFFSNCPLQLPITPLITVITILKDSIHLVLIESPPLDGAI